MFRAPGRAYALLFMRQLASRPAPSSKMADAVTVSIVLEGEEFPRFVTACRG